MIEQTAIDALCIAAHEAWANSYAPYSHFPVGAAILMKDGSIVKGCNVENSSYSLSNCAERTAMFSAIAMGWKPEDTLAIAIAAPTKSLISPCGACRQVMSELLGPDKIVILDNGKGRKIYTVAQLLPDSFSLQ